MRSGHPRRLGRIVRGPPGRPGGRSGRWGVRGVAAALLAGVSAACGQDATAPDVSDLELLVAGPPVQFAAPSSSPPDPFRVSVRKRSTQQPQAGQGVAWRILEGQGARLGSSTSLTDSAGVATNTLTLGAGRGLYRVEASFAGSVEGAVEFEVWAVDAPVVESVAPTTARGGESVVLTGRNFSSVASHNVVTFQGIRGAVRDATPTSLTVAVPACLPALSASVEVSLGEARSAPVPLALQDGGVVDRLGVGEARDLDLGEGAACLRLPGEGATYLALAYAAGSVAGARYDFALPGVVAGGGVSAGGGTGGRGSGGAGERDGLPRRAGADGAALPPQEILDARVRELERRLLSGRRSGAPGPWRAAPHAGPGGAPFTAPARVTPQPGERRTFTVLNGQGSFTSVTAVVRHVSERAVFYEDQEVGGSALSSADYGTFGREFDDPIHATVTEVFGGLSDLDGNQRVVVLFTPVVNRMTPRGSNGFVGGFFYGLDLLTDRQNSNRGEIFYALVPDPQGRFGDARTSEQVLRTVPPILAHELQHMVHFNERVLLRSAQGSDAVWLSEGLAQMAEDLVADVFARRGDGARATVYRAGNVARGRMFLARTQGRDKPSLLIGSGNGTLEERGAGWLFVRYLQGHYGGEGALRALTGTTRTGIDNVATVTGRPWETLLGDWGVALYAGSEPGLTDPTRADPHHRFEGVDLRTLLASSTQPWPLSPPVQGQRSFQWSGELTAAALDHLLLTPPAGTTVSLGLGAPVSAPFPPEARIRLRVVRLR